MKKEITEFSRVEVPEISKALQFHNPCKVVAVVGDRIYVYYGARSEAPKRERASNNLNLARQVAHCYQRQTTRLGTCESFLALIGALRKQLNIQKRPRSLNTEEINHKAIDVLRDLPPH